MCSIFDEIIVYNDLTKKKQNKTKRKRKERRTEEVEYEKPSWEIETNKTMIDKIIYINMDTAEVS